MTKRQDWVLMLGVALILLVVAMSTGCQGAEPKPVANQPVLMVFTAKWCHNCPNAVELEELAEDFPGVIIMPVDIDENPFLASKYRIKRVPTFFLCDDQFCRVTYDIKEVREWLGQLP